VKKGYSGTAILSKVNPVNVWYDIGIPKHDKEGRSMTAEFKDFILIVAYVPNSGDGLLRLDYRVEEWDADFQKHILKMKSEFNKPVIVAGDLNVAHNEIDIYDPRGKDNAACFTKKERESFQRMLDMGFIDSFRHLYPKTQ
jgi:exodeoxyribonuclease III